MTWRNSKISFELQDLPDIIRTIILVNFKKARTGKLKKSSIKTLIGKMCSNLSCLTQDDIDRTLKEMVQEGLIIVDKEIVCITGKGKMLAGEWHNFLMRSEPVMEIVSGITDGSITSLVVIISSTFFGKMPFQYALFAAFLTLAAVAITNFSSFFLGGLTEELADLVTLERLMNYSVSDIPDKRERGKALDLLSRLFDVFKNDIRKESIMSAVICGVTTFLAGSFPIILFLLLETPWDVILSLSVVSVFVGVFLIKYRSSRSRVNWKLTMLETLAIIAIASVASILLGSI
ncbi:MAG: hypothetical protein GYA24_18325 [Candidatus Lokiarchaeota archaeon]|nr:hypothetical protein [Candidatus Lokiarchaeota archaeon]